MRVGALPSARMRFTALVLALTQAMCLEDGLTLGWTTPIFVRRFLPSEDAAIRAVRDAVIAAHDSFRPSRETDSCDDVPLNDRFYEAQRRRFEDGMPPLFDSNTLRSWRTAWLGLVREYVSVAAGPEAAHALFSRELQVFVWGGVHRGCSYHQTHVHEDSAVSGTFYLDLPPGSGEIAFEDPRGMRPPFSRNRMVHRPEAGQLLLFPPWLSHGVLPSCAATGAAGGAARVALSFNVLSVPPRVAGRAAREATNDWEVLADASVHIPTE